MQLSSFRVTEFRSVQDSGWIDVEQITALIGTNESGKTNILLPLWKLNPADEGKIDLKTISLAISIMYIVKPIPNRYLSTRSTCFCRTSKLHLPRFLNIRPRNLQRLLFPRIMMRICFGNFHVRLG